MKVFAATATALLFAGCTPSPEGPAPTPESTTAMSSAARWVKPEAAGKRVLAEFPARVVSDAEGEAEITALYPGQVTKVLVQPGDAVVKGAPVAEVAVPELAAAVAEYEACGVQLKFLGARVGTLSDLRKQGLARQSAVFELQMKVAELEAQQGLAQSKVRSAGLSAQDRRQLSRSGHLSLVTPVAGIVTDVNIHLGSTINPDGQVLVHVQGRGSSRVEAQLPSALPAGATLEFSSLRGETLALNPGPLASAVDPDSGTLRMWFALSQERLNSGLRGTLVVRAEGNDWYEVPAQAVVKKGGQSSIFVKRGATPQWMPAALRLSTGATAIVQAGLQDGDHVLANGQEAPGFEGQK